MSCSPKCQFCSHTFLLCSLWWALIEKSLSVQPPEDRVQSMSPLFQIFVILLLCFGLQSLKDGSSSGLPKEHKPLYLDINLLLWDRHACLASTKPSKLLSLRKKLAVSRATGGCDGWSQSNDLWNLPIDLSCCTQVRRHRALFAACRWFISAPLLVPLALWSFMWFDQRTPVWGGKLMLCLWMSGWCLRP